MLINLIFRLVYALIFGGFSFLLFDDLSAFLFIFIIAFIAGDSEWAFWKTKKGKVIARFISIIAFFLLLILTIKVSDVGIIRKLAAWSLILALYLLEKLKKYIYNIQENENF